MPKNKIQTAVDNKDKQHTYAYWKRRYTLAMKYGFYFEAMMIDYALLEDRLASVLYHSGVMKNRQKLSMDAGATKKIFRQMMMDQGLFSENERLQLKNISGKVKLLRTILLWVDSSENVQESERFLKALKYQYESADIGGSMDALDKILDWCAYRNEIVHASLNKNVESLYEEIEKRAAEGFDLANFLDSQERIIKKSGAIRKAANLQN